MKNIIKNYLILFVLALGLFTCETDDKVTDDVQDTFTNGAVLRTVQTISASLNLIDLNSVWSIEIEEQDADDGDLLETVNVYVTLKDNTPDSVTSTSETLVESFDASEFTDGPFGLPRMTLSFTLGDFVNTLGLVDGDFNCGDQMDIRLELLLTDGRVFSKGDVGGSVTGGFFASPFNYTPFIIALLPSDTLYEGQYSFEHIGGGIFGGSDFAENGSTVTIATVNNTTKLITAAELFSSLGGGFGTIDIEFQFICGDIIFSELGSGLSCGGPELTWSPATVHTTYDLVNPDDTDFIVNFIANSIGGCGGSAFDSSMRLIKL